MGKLDLLLIKVTHVCDVCTELIPQTSSLAGC